MSDPSGPSQPPSAIPPLKGGRPPTLGEKALFDAYSDAVKGALAAATGAADKVLTAVFSIGTAYVALLGLLRPDKAVGALIVAIPFVFLGLAGVAAMIALVAGVAPSDPKTVADVNTELSGAIRAKKFLTGAAIVLVVVALASAALIVTQSPFPGVLPVVSTPTGAPAS